MGKYKKIFKYIKLDMPLVVLDLETTGLNISSDKIVELAYIKIWPDGKVKKDDIMINPQIPISKEAVAVHGYTKKDVVEQPTFRQKAQELWDVFNDCYYSGYNIINFDLPILRREFIRVGMDFDYKSDRVIDSRIIFQTMARRTLSAAYKYYCNKEFKNAHSALADSEVAAEILLCQLEEYEDVRDLGFINRIHESFTDEMYLYTTRKFDWRNGEAYFAFSKYRDRPLSEIAKKDPGFLKWMLTADFSDKTKTIVQRALKGDFSKNGEEEKF